MWATVLYFHTVGNHLQQCLLHIDNNSMFIMLHSLDNAIFHTICTTVQNHYHTVPCQYHTTQQQYHASTTQYSTIRYQLSSWSQWHSSERWLSVNLAFCCCHSCQWLPHYTVPHIAVPHSKGTATQQRCCHIAEVLPHIPGAATQHSAK